MHPSLADVVRALEAFYPPSTAQSWDQVGLVSGDLAQPVAGVLFAVDPTLAVIDEARSLGADLVVTHHPLLLRGVHSVATSTAKGAAITALVVHDIALYVAHTNADVAEPGVNDALAQACGLTDLAPLAVVEGQPLGRVGDLPAPLSLGDFAAALHAALPPSAGGIRVAGPPDAPVRRIAVMGGAGDDMFDHVRAVRCRCLRHGGPAPPPGAGGPRAGAGRRALPRRRGALGHRVVVALGGGTAAGGSACGRGPGGL